jgi:predicted Zn-dependent protease
MSRRLAGLSFLVLLLLVTGCSVNPVTGENQLHLVSTSQEIAIGEKNYGPMQQAQGAQYVVDPAVQAYVAEVGNKLAAVSDAPQLPYQFVVLNNPVPNAWALPGGKIAINRGLLVLLQDESELAAVLGHEVVHAAARHSAAQMTRSTFIGLGSQIVTVAAQTEGYGDLAGLATQLGGGAWMASYGRQDELESDYYGMEYMARAGYSPQGAVRLQELFVSLKDGKSQDSFSQLFASHPPSQERVAANIERAATLPPGEKHRARYQQKIAQIKKDQRAYKAQDKAMAALQEKRAREALGYLDKAIAIQPGEGQFWELRGHAWKMLEDKARAEQAYSTAIQKSPDYFAPRLYRGLLRFDVGRQDAAYADLEKSYSMLPTEVAAFHLGELSLARGDEQRALGFYRNASGGKSEVSGLARQRLATLEMADMPGKYVLSRPYVHSSGYLRVAVKNNSPVAVAAVKVQLAKMEAGDRVGQVTTLRGSYHLEPGQEISINIRIGPFENAAAASAYRTRVIKATPVEPRKAN